MYRGAGVADGERSLAYRLRLQAADHTLTDDELTAVRTKVVAAVDQARRDAPRLSPRAARFLSCRVRMRAHRTWRDHPTTVRSAAGGPSGWGR